MTDDQMVTYLRTTLDEVEAIARAATPGLWHVAKDFYGPVVQSDAGVCVADERDHDHNDPNDSGSPLLEADARHIAANDPASVLRQVAGTRKHLKVHTPFEATYGGRVRLECNGCPYGTDLLGDTTYEDWPCETTKIEAERWGWTDDR